MAIWSNLAGGTAADTARIDLAIAYAEGIVNDSFRERRYSIPFNPVPAVVVDWCAKLAGIWLFMCRPHYNKDRESAEGFMDVRQSAFDEMATYAAGQRAFDCAKATDKDVNSPSAI